MVNGIPQARAMFRRKAAAVAAQAKLAARQGGEEVAQAMRYLAPKDERELVDSIRVEDAASITTRKGERGFIGVVVKAGDETTIVTNSSGGRFQNAKLQAGMAGEPDTGAREDYSGNSEGLDELTRSRQSETAESRESDVSVLPVDVTRWTKENVSFCSSYARRSAAQASTFFCSSARSTWARASARERAIISESSRSAASRSAISLRSIRNIVPQAITTTQATATRNCNGRFIRASIAAR